VITVGAPWSGAGSVVCGSWIPGPSPFARASSRGRLVPAGEVLTYGEVAREAGRPGAARAVGAVLRRHGAEVPWWRVVPPTAGSRPVAAEQQRRLRAEGVRVQDGRVGSGGPPPAGARALRSGASPTREVDRVSRRGKLHHLELYVTDLEVSVRFWGWLLPELGWQPFQEWDEGCSYRHGDLYLALVEAPVGGAASTAAGPGSTTWPSSVDERAEIDELTEGLRERGVRDPVPRAAPVRWGGDHYAVFFEDPDGLKVEVVAAGDRRAGARRHVRRAPGVRTVRALSAQRSKAVRGTSSADSCVGTASGRSWGPGAVRKATVRPLPHRGLSLRRHRPDALRTNPARVEGTRAARRGEPRVSRTANAAIRSPRRHR
jgi:alkylated DNA nucleotide flippase Atl1/catechol 2,3-dioxygenase-like lactoylglutathione lyase family enzyme